MNNNNNSIKYFSVFSPAVSLPFPLDRQVILLYLCTDSLLETGPNRCKVITYFGEFVMFCLLPLFLFVHFLRIGSGKGAAPAFYIFGQAFPRDAFCVCIPHYYVCIGLVP